MFRALVNFYHRLGSPPHFYGIAGRFIPWLIGAALLLMAVGLYWGLVVAPTDYEQGEAYRIIYIHVPAAWLSMFVYVCMAFAGAFALIWRMKMAEVMAVTAAPIGAGFTLLALATGSIWGKPMWGTWWVWDARLTSELVLLFLYLGVMALDNAIEDRRLAGRAVGILALVGVVNIPIIHYSVEWWNTLHQGPTVTRMDAPAIHWSMLVPLLIMALAFMLYFAGTWLMRARNEVLRREGSRRWAMELPEAS
jgi:heme exporter protein C